MAETINLQDCGITLLARATVHMQTADGAQTVYTVPAGKKAIVTSVVIRNPTGSLAGGTDFNLGDGANCDTWLANLNLSTMTAITDYWRSTQDNAKQSSKIFDAGDAFGIKPDTGSTGDYDAIMEVFGYEFVA